MKRLLVVATSVLCLVVFFFACSDLQNLSEPKKVVVKPGDAKYSIPFGGYTVAFNDYLNVAKLQENLTGGDDEDSDNTKPRLSVYDYQDPNNKSLQQYIIEYPITSISLNPDDYLGEMLGFLDGFGTGDTNDGDKFNIPVEIPEDLKNGLPMGKDIDLPDLNDEIVGRIGEFEIKDTQTEFLVPERNLSSAELESVPGYIPDIDIKIPLELTTVTFSNGSLDITISTADTDFRNDYVFNLTAELCDNYGYSIHNDEGYPASATATFDQNHTNETLKLPIDNRELPQNMKIHLTGSVKGSSGILHTYSVDSVRFTKDNLRVRKVTGLNIEPIEIDQSMEDEKDSIGGELLREATIAEGNITVSSVLPTGWSGVTAGVDISVDGAIDKVSFKDDSRKSGYLFYREANLHGSHIDGTKSLSAKVSNIVLSFNNATIELKDEQPSISVVCKANITELIDVKVSLEKLLGDETLTSLIDQDIGSNITDYVVSAIVDELNLQADIDTNLAIEALWVKPTIRSDALHIDENDSNLDYTNVISGEPIRVSYGKENGWKGFELTELQGDKVDFEITLDIQGDNHGQNPYNKTDDTLTLTSLDLTRNDYYLKVALGAPQDAHIFECEKLVLKIDDGIIPKGPIETGLSIGDMFDNLVDDENSEQSKLINDLINAIELQGIEGYLYVTAPKTEGEGAVNFSELLPPITGSVEASYVPKDSSTAKTKTLIEKGKLKVRNNVPSFASLADEKRLITTDAMFTEYYSARTEENSLTGIINDRANDLKFDYNISFGGGKENTITLKKEQINALQDAANDTASGSANAEIAMTIAVVLPLKLNIKNNISVENIMALAGDDEDIDFLGDEDSDSDFSEYTDYTKALKSLELWYQLKNPFDGLKIDATLFEKNDFIPEKTMTFDDKKHKIDIEQGDIDKILTASSFIPRISMTLQAGLVSVTRNAELKMNAALVVKTKNDAEIEAFEFD